MKTRKRMCGIWQLKKGKLRQYLKAHAAVWPEMRSAMRKAGIRNYSMFYRPDGMLVGYFEAKDPVKSLRICAGTAVSRRWQSYMRPFFEGKPLFLKEYFYVS